MENSIEDFARAGSQRWLQIAINRAPAVLLDALQPALKLDSGVTINWRSPLESEKCREYWDAAALHQLEMTLPHRELSDFWPTGGPHWDAIGKTSDGQPIFVEAKAHIREMNSQTHATDPQSVALIQKSLNEARQHFAPNSTADWSKNFYQYANRLAHHYLFRTVNKLPSHLIFLYFINATDMNGPESREDWQSAIKALHDTLGLPQIEHLGIHEVFVDVSALQSRI